MKLSFGPVRFGGRSQPRPTFAAFFWPPHQKNHGEWGTHEAVDSDDKVVFVIKDRAAVDISNIKKYNTY